MSSNEQEMLSLKIDRKKISYDITNYRGEIDVIWGFYLSILGDDIFRTLERIESNQPYYTTLTYEHFQQTVLFIQKLKTVLYF